ncbi:hypothetical protein [Actinophytocola glycyrrhizae]|uniref:AAA+ ATPase domain-containing protein n=1 Tax=Actinophytocola glycyrrhizae TaxID=2044873 RepID=A0ABV9S0X3_9PSEU
MDTLAHFVRPEPFGKAATALERGRAVVLHGPPGQGKRTSALALLRTVTDESLFLLSPQLTMAELRERTYDEGLGYAVIDHVAPPDTDGDFSWRVLTDRLTNAGAYLVVTTTTEPQQVGDAISHVPWHRPDLEQVLRTRMTTDLTEDAFSELATSLESCRQVRDVVELACRLDRGEKPEEAAGHFDVTAETAVASWFDRGPSRRQVMEVTTLAFAHGTAERAFELDLAVLEKHLRRHMPEPSPEEGVAEESLPQVRRRLVDPDGLIVRRTVMLDVGPRTELVFASLAYHRHVVRALWNRMDVAFWDAVHGWLNEIVARHPWRVAIGLAAVAEVAFNEALALLQQWSAGSRGGGGQRAAIYTLTIMARNDQMAPAALQIATRWIHGSDPARQWTAAMAFGDQLGVRFPLEAINKLWRLCTQADTGTGNVAIALANLFTTLARDTPDAGMVLRVLSNKLARFGRPGGSTILRSVAISTLSVVLGARDHRTGRQSVLLHLGRSPDQIHAVARLWAMTLDNRPTRLRAIESLRDTLKDLAEHDKHATSEVQRMGEALAVEMTELERRRLRDDMRKVTARQGGGNDNELIAKLFSALLTALGREGSDKENP